MTDEFASYNGLNKYFLFHGVVRHSKGEYVNGDIHTNTLEGFFGLLKRGIIGVYHHVGEQHLHRYLSEFDFRFNRRGIEDDERIEGKRLMYRDSSEIVSVLA